MARFRVRFKGLLNKNERARLAAAGIALEASEPTEVGGIAGAGRPIYTVSAEASSPQEALATVREALDPDTGNFSDWEADGMPGQTDDQKSRRSAPLTRVSNKHRNLCCDL